MALSVWLCAAAVQALQLRLDSQCSAATAASQVDVAMQVSAGCLHPCMHLCLQRLSLRRSLCTAESGLHAGHCQRRLSCNSSKSGWAILHHVCAHMPCRLEPPLSELQ